MPCRHCGRWVDDPNGYQTFCRKHNEWHWVCACSLCAELKRLQRAVDVNKDKELLEEQNAAVASKVAEAYRLLMVAYMDNYLRAWERRGGAS